MFAKTVTSHESHDIPMTDCTARAACMFALLLWQLVLWVGMEFQCIGTELTRCQTYIYQIRKLYSIASTYTGSIVSQRFISGWHLEHNKLQIENVRWHIHVVLFKTPGEVIKRLTDETLMYMYVWRTMLNFCSKDCKQVVGRIPPESPVKFWAGSTEKSERTENTILHVHWCRPNIKSVVH